jgi:L-alanine-DL-glutamate epimerase-like enolase superfamily enzyme
MFKITWKQYELPFQYPFTISKGTKTHQPTLIVCVEFRGIKGYGEAPSIGYYNITTDKMVSDLQAKRGMLERYAYTEPERYWHYLHHLFPGNPFLVCALDMAYCDFYGKSKRANLSQLWNIDSSNPPLTDYTIGLDSIDKMVEKMDAKPWPIYKIKLGMPNDIEIVEELRKHTEGIIRVDANAGWTVIEALEKIEKLAQLGVEFVEQPLAKEDWDGMKILYEKSPLPLIADESCVSEKDVQKCVGYFHGINIKFTKCSGLTPARNMITEARKEGLKVMIGSMNESTIGSAAIAHLAPLADYLDCDGPLLLSKDLASGLLYDNGTVTVSSEPGLGITLFEPF